jgi:choice-of-anchor C domain-containing protein
MKLSFSKLAAAATLLLGATGASANLITNGDFETGTDPGSFTTITAPGALTGWNVDSGSIDYIGSYWQDASVVGTRSVDLSGNDAGSIRQSFPTTASGLYEVKFSLSGNPDGARGIKTLHVSLTNSLSVLILQQDFTFDTSVASNDSNNMGWVAKSLVFQAVDSETTLRFLSLTSGGWGPALDEVSVNAVPVPAAIWLLGSALLGVGLIARKRGGGNV